MSQYTAEELLWHSPKLEDAYFDDTITVLEHTPTMFYRKEYTWRILKTKTWIDIDVGTAYGVPPAILGLDDLEEFYGVIKKEVIPCAW